MHERRILSMERPTIVSRSSLIFKDMWEGGLQPFSLRFWAGNQQVLTKWRTQKGRIFLFAQSHRAVPPPFVSHARDQSWDPDSLNPDPNTYLDPAFQVKDMDPRFWWPKNWRKKNTDENFFWLKFAIYLCPSYRRRLQHSKDNIQHFKKWVCGLFLPSWLLDPDQDC